MSHKWNYKNLILLGFSIILAIYILTSDITKNFILELGSLSYLGSFISGIFFAFGFTAAPASASIILLGKTTNPILLGLIGGFGAMISDYLIFFYIKHSTSSDLKYIIYKTKLDKIKKLNKSRYHFLVPIIAGFIIASPLPDEIGSFVFGISDYPTKKFLILSYFLNSAGIFILALLG